MLLTHYTEHSVATLVLMDGQRILGCEDKLSILNILHTPRRYKILPDT